jgi:hypothetical protein
MWGQNTGYLASIIDTFEARSAPGDTSLFLLPIDSPEHFGGFEVDCRQARSPA